MAKETQFLLPIGTFRNPNKTKHKQLYTTQKGKPRTLTGYNREVKNLNKMLREEIETQKEYEETGIDRTDGHRYWSTFRR